MTQPALERAKAAWGRVYEGLSQEEVDRRVLGFGALVRAIAAKGAVAPEEFAAEIGLSAERGGELLSGLAASGAEVDESGRIVGAALTTRETAHSIAFGARSLFAWCALDTLFIPGLLGELAEVASTCPRSGAPIRLTVAPEGVTAVNPPETVLSVVLPAVDSPGPRTGPASPT